VTGDFAAVDVHDRAGLAAHSYDDHRAGGDHSPPRKAVVSLWSALDRRNLRGLLARYTWDRQRRSCDERYG
jgi:hypothetical protein